MMLKRLKQNKGETLTETLASVVIISLALLMLPGAVVAAARVNASAKKQVIYMENVEDAAEGVDTGTCDFVFSVTGNTTTLKVENIKVKRFGTEETGLYEMGLK